MNPPESGKNPIVSAEMKETSAWNNVKAPVEQHNVEVTYYSQTHERVSNQDA